MSKKQSSIDWLIEKLDQNFDYVADTLIEQAKAMHKEEIKMIIEHYHNRMFYLELTGIELENITEMMYNETFGGQE